MDARAKILRDGQIIRSVPPRLPMICEPKKYKLEDDGNISLVAKHRVPKQ